MDEFKTRIRRISGRTDLQFYAPGNSIWESIKEPADMTVVIQSEASQ